MRKQTTKGSQTSNVFWDNLEEVLRINPELRDYYGSPPQGEGTGAKIREPCAADGRKVILAVEPGYRESTESWSGVLRNLKERGLNCPRLVIGDGHLGIWGALSNVYPDAAEQRCRNHKIMNVLDKLPKKAQPQAKQRLQGVVAYAESPIEAEEKRDTFLAWCGREGYRAAGETLLRDWDRMVTFYRFPKEHWKHLRTTNVVESPFAALRLRTDAAKRYKKVENATASE